METRTLKHISRDAVKAWLEDFICEITGGQHTVETLRNKLEDKLLELHDNGTLTEALLPPNSTLHIRGRFLRAIRSPKTLFLQETISSKSCSASTPTCSGKTPLTLSPQVK